MEKTKKLSKSSIAVIVLAILLALSMIMGITGAWFTQVGNSGTSTQQLHFGHITNGLDGNKLVKDSAMTVRTADVRAVPGDYFDLGQVEIKYTADIDTYLFVKTYVKFEVALSENEGEPVWQDGTEAQFNELFGAGAYANLNAIAAMAQNPEEYQGKEAAADSGTLGNGYAWYLYGTKAVAGDPETLTQRADADYVVHFKGANDARFTVQGTVTNHEDAGTSPTDWTDAYVRISYVVDAKVCQAENIGADAQAAWTAAGFEAIAAL